jgi:hypothetical protein
LSVTQADVPFTAAGRSFRAGDFIIHTRGNQADHDKLKALVQQTGLTGYGIAEPIPPAAPLHAIKVGLLKPNTSTMPEGWTRLQLDHAGFPYTSLSPTDISNGVAGYHVVIIPSMSPQGLVNGAGNNMPPEFRAGIGTNGMANLKSFVENGGTLVLMGQASTLPIAQNWDI